MLPSANSCRLCSKMSCTFLAPLTILVGSPLPPPPLSPRRTDFWTKTRGGGLDKRGGRILQSEESGKNERITVKLQKEGGFRRWEDKFQEQRGSQAACWGSHVASHGLLPVVSPRLRLAEDKCRSISTG